MIYTSAGEKEVKIKKNDPVMCFRKLPSGGKVVGYVLFRKKNILSDDYVKILSDHKFVQIENVNYRLKTKKSLFKKIVGYIETDVPDEYVAIIKPRFIPLWLSALCYNTALPAVLISAVLIAGAVGAGVAVYNQVAPGDLHIGLPGHTKDPTGDDDISDYDGMDGLEDSTETEKYTVIDAIAYDGEYLEVRPSDTIPLGNNAENEGMYLQFIVNDKSGTEVYVSPKLNAGEKVDWSPCEYLDEGLQDVVINVNVYHADTNMQDVGTDLHITLKVVK